MDSIIKKQAAKWCFTAIQGMTRDVIENGIRKQFGVYALFDYYKENFAAILSDIDSILNELETENNICKPENQPTTGIAEGQMGLLICISGMHHISGTIYHTADPTLEELRECYYGVANSLKAAQNIFKQLEGKKQ